MTRFALLALTGQMVEYTLHRGRRRLSLRVDERGLAVGAPANLSLQAIEAFLLQHAAWATEKLAEHAARSRLCHLRIQDGSRLPLLGQPVSVRVTTGGNRAFWQMDEPQPTLWLAARPTADLNRLTQQALQRRAREVFLPRVTQAAKQLGVAEPRVSLSSARTRWGSCSTASGIRLNWRLIHLRPELIDYVVAHEAAHLVEMNHSPRFWTQVEKLFPNWRAARVALKREGAELPQL